VRASAAVDERLVGGHCWEGSSVRLTPLRLALLFGAALLLLGPTTGLTQGPGKGKRGGDGSPDGGGFQGKGGDGGGLQQEPGVGCQQPGGGCQQPGGGLGRPGGGMQFDPSQWAGRSFDRLANGANAIRITDIQDPRDPTAQEKAAAWAQAHNITN